MFPVYDQNLQWGMVRGPLSGAMTASTARDSTSDLSTWWWTGIYPAIHYFCTYKITVDCFITTFLTTTFSDFFVCVAANPLSSVVMNKKGGLHFRKYIRHSLRMYTTREKKVKSNNSEKLLCYVIKKAQLLLFHISLHILNSPVETLFQPSENMPHATSIVSGTSETICHKYRQL